MRAPNPFFFVYLFANLTILLPVAITGIRVYTLWYSPLADTGRVTFLHPFLEIMSVVTVASLLTGGYLYFRESPAFYPLDRMSPLSIIKSLIHTRAGRFILLAYSPLYFASFLVVSGMLLVPGLNVAGALLPLTNITYQGVGVPIFGRLVPNVDMLIVGVVNTTVLSASVLLGYYITSLIHTSQLMARRGVKGSLATMSVQGIGGFLAASTPAIGTTAVICCLTPTGVNSLLYLLSASVPFIGKKLIWSYGTIAGLFWLTGALQGAELLSTTILGFAMLGLSVYQIRKLAEKLRNASLRVETVRR